jgi:Ca-activated chloride channel family protein
MPRLFSLVALAFASLGAAAAPQAPLVFRAGTDITHLAVTVTDRRGDPVTGLNAGDFEIVEDGRPQPIRHFARATDADASRLHAGVMFDTSGSMKEDLEMARNGAIELLRRLPEPADVTFVEFDADVRVSVFSPADLPRLIERIRAKREEVWRTTLYDAFAVYLSRASGQDGRSVLIAFTDGGDARSATSYGDLIDLVRAAPGVLIYGIGLVYNQSPSVGNENRLRLSRIAEESGGQAFFPYSMSQIGQAYDRVLAELAAQYSLGYVSSNPARDGRWRAVRVRIRNPALEGLRVRTRSGYFAPIDDKR